MQETKKQKRQQLDLEARNESIFSYLRFLSPSFSEHSLNKINTL